MTDFREYIASQGASTEPSTQHLELLIKQYPWFCAARTLRRALSHQADTRLATTDPWRMPYRAGMAAVDIAALRHISSEDIIDKFLREDTLRIVANENSSEEELQIQPQFEDEDDLVSESLANIYLKQGHSQRAIAIYRKLSLLNPEKSVYFAELITRIENNN